MTTRKHNFVIKPEERQLSDLTFKLQDCFDEVRRRVRPGMFHWAGEPEQTVGGHCDCEQCRHQRRALWKELHERVNQETCNNNQHRQYCEEHSRFYHHWDRCQDCVRQTTGYWAPGTVQGGAGTSDVCAGCFRAVEYCICKMRRDIIV